MKNHFNEFPMFESEEESEKKSELDLEKLKDPNFLKPLKEHLYFNIDSGVGGFGQQAMAAVRARSAMEQLNLLEEEEKINCAEKMENPEFLKSLLMNIRSCSMKGIRGEKFEATSAVLTISSAKQLNLLKGLDQNEPNDILENLKNPSFLNTIKEEIDSKIGKESLDSREIVELVLLIVSAKELNLLEDKDMERIMEYIKGPDFLEEFEKEANYLVDSGSSGNRANAYNAVWVISSAKQLGLIKEIKK